MMTQLTILDTVIRLPLTFSADLPFSAADKKAYPWLGTTPRRYCIVEEVGKGGRATAYRGFVAKNELGDRWEGSPEVVLKIPNLDANARFSIVEVQEFLTKQNQESVREWQLTRTRLHTCRYANPIIDFASVSVLWANELLQVPITVQLWLHDCVSLDTFLLEKGYRAEPYVSEKGKPVYNWGGLRQVDVWIDLAKAIAIGLADIHRRRVVHGDIWPPNIFMRRQSGPDDIAEPVFIDFGEAFPVEPKGDTRAQQRDHAYRAPERMDSQSIITQQADVYSFGKLLLHLATGEEPILQPAVRGHQRRAQVRARMLELNKHLVDQNPFIMDLICNCIIVDPIDRPSMDEVVRSLDTYVDFARREEQSVPQVDKLGQSLLLKWDHVSKEAKRRGSTVAPVFEKLICQRLEEVESMIDCLPEDVIVFRDTRERLMRILIDLFQPLGAGDRFISLTSPRMWQGTALGLDGRYFTSSKLAAARGAAIQRCYVVSIQELGIKWSEAWASNLSNLARTLKAQYVDVSHPDRNVREQKLVVIDACSSLAESIEVAISRFKAAQLQKEADTMADEICSDGRLRLQLVAQSYKIAIDEFGDAGFPEGDFEKLAQNMRNYLGLLICPTMHEVRKYKTSHPVSVFYYSKVGEKGDHLLMMTDCHGRTPLSVFPGGEHLSATQGEPKPELRGLTLFRSVFGDPQNRIKSLQQVFGLSNNIGCWIKDLVSTFPVDESTSSGR